MTSYVRSNSVVSRVIAGETLIIPVRKGVGDLASIYSLNDVASVIWRALSAPCSKDQIVNAIEQEFAAERNEIGQDLEIFLQEMISAGLIGVAEAAA